MPDRHSRYRFKEVLQDEKNSPFHKYQDLVIGKRSLGALVRHELNMLLLSSLPGMLGLGLRKIFFPSMFGAVGKNVIFGHHLSLRMPHRIFIGANTMVDDFVFLSFRGEKDQGLRIGENVLLGRFTQLKVRGGDLELGNDVNIGPYCHFGTVSKLTVGEHSLFGANCYIGGVRHGFSDSSKPIVEQELTSRGPTEIGSDVWLGAQVIVNEGIRIGDGAIIGANAVVTKDVPAYSISAGVPARVIGQRGEQETPEGTCSDL